MKKIYFMLLTLLLLLLVSCVNSANSNEVCQSRQIGVDEWRGSSSTIDNARIVHLLSWASRAYAGVL